MASYSFEVLNHSAFLNSKLLVNCAMGEHEAVPQQYPFYIDLLRNERPVFAFVDSTQASNTKLSCKLEPVGEGK